MMEMGNKEMWDVNERLRQEEAQMVSHASTLQVRIKELRSLALQLKQVAAATDPVCRYNKNGRSQTIEQLQQLLLNHYQQQEEVNGTYGHQIPGPSDHPSPQQQEMVTGKA
ncbi:hypothetical protein LINPERHAP1_LOCUS14836, partial [Linum perenne]